MKKVILLAIAMVATVTFTNAQTFKKSDKIVEGTVSYSQQSGENATYSVNPSVGYFLNDKTAVGVYGGFGKDGDSKTSTFGVYARHFFLNIGKNLKTYTQMNASNTSAELAGTKTTTFGIGAGLGVNYFLTSKIVLTMDVANLLNYTSQSSNTSFSIGWNGVNNPLSASKFGVLYRF